MINYYQPFLLPFLGSKKSILPRRIKRYYYHSFEDALWDLLAKKRAPRETRILVPDFYCTDVVENIKKHGYTPIFYPVDRHFQIQPKALQSIIDEVKPHALILFHACGIQNICVTKEFIQKQRCLVIEDAVHRLVDPSSVHLFGDHHFVIDSLRKVSPIPGSFIYGTDIGLSYTPEPFSMDVGYLFTSLSWYIAFRIALTTSVVCNSTRLASFAHDVILKHHDDIIGDRMLPQRGIPPLAWIAGFINPHAIAARKRIQVTEFTRLSKKLFRTHPFFYPVRMSLRDYGNLHIFPVGMKYVPKGFIPYLHSRHMAVWCKFEDSSWALNHHVLFLPLGFHISDEEIHSSMNTLSTSLFLFPKR